MDQLAGIAVDRGSSGTPNLSMNAGVKMRTIIGINEGTKIMNDRERELWVLNDEGLYMWWKSSRTPLRTFIKNNRGELTEAINRRLK